MKAKYRPNKANDHCRDGSIAVIDLRIDVEGIAPKP